MVRLHQTFSYPDFTRLFAVRLSGNFATGMLGVALGWRVYDLARLTMSVESAAFLVGMIGLAQFGPMFFLALPAGQFVDSHDRRKILAACMALEVLIGFLLLGSLLLPTEHEMTAIFVAAGLFGAVLFGGVGSVIVGFAWIKLFPTLAKVDRVQHVEVERTA